MTRSLCLYYHSVSGVGLMLEQSISYVLHCDPKHDNQRLMPWAIRVPDQEYSDLSRTLEYDIA